MGRLRRAGVGPGCFATAGLAGGGGAGGAALVVRGRSVVRSVKRGAGKCIVGSCSTGDYVEARGWLW